MKKLTLISIILFGLILGGVLMMSYFYPPVVSLDNITGTGTIAKTVPLTLSEVAKHNQPNDCYVIVNQKVYDVSTYIAYHPGGTDTITSRCAGEVTGIFASIHSNFAWNLLGKYYIGDFLTNEAENSNLSDSFSTLNILAEKIKNQYQGAEVLGVKPKSSFYVSKIIYNGKLYEVHLDKDGNILNLEIANDEVNWDSWDTDSDDN